MSTSTDGHDSYLIENWDTEYLILHLREQKLDLDNDDFGILRNEKITGQTFLELTKEELQGIGLKLGPVKVLLEEIKSLKEKPKRPFSSYKSLKEVLAKYDIDSSGTDTIPLFSLQTHEIQYSNKHFEHCIDNILFRMKHYGSLVVDSLESMRNEYVSTILHTALHIAGDVTNKEFSMRPEYEIIGDECSGRVDYAIKV